MDQILMDLPPILLTNPHHVVVFSDNTWGGGTVKCGVKEIWGWWCKEKHEVLPREEQVQ